MTIRLLPRSEKWEQLPPFSFSTDDRNAHKVTVDRQILRPCLQQSTYFADLAGQIYQLAVETLHFSEKARVIDWVNVNS